MVSGSVGTPAPAVKNVITKSSIDSVNAISAPAMMPGLISGSVTSRNVCQGVAPRSRAASKIDSSMPARRARTMIATKPMQNVVWATITVASDRLSAPNVEMKKISSATPSRISGIAIGVSTMNGRILER